LKSGHGCFRKHAKAYRQIQVSIPLKSGHGCFGVNILTRVEDGCLNPFEIRAWVLRLGIGVECCNLSVSIPLKSGHGCFLRKQIIEGWSLSLNPFEIRAWVLPQTLRGLTFGPLSLNPFEIRAWVLRKNPIIQIRLKVSIPLKSGHGCFHRQVVNIRNRSSLNPFEIRAWVLRTTWSLEQTLVGLNPFEIRAWVLLQKIGVADKCLESQSL